jgi:hypothetical protein
MISSDTWDIAMTDPATSLPLITFWSIFLSIATPASMQLLGEKVSGKKYTFCTSLDDGKSDNETY